MRVCYMALSLGSTEPQGRPIAITPLCSKKERAAAAARQIMLPYPLALWNVCVVCMFVLRISLPTRTHYASLHVLMSGNLVPALRQLYKSCPGANDPRA